MVQAISNDVSRTRSQSGEVRPGRETLLAFLALVIVAGGNSVAVRFTVRELDPFWGAAIRFIAASLVFFGLMAVRRIRMPRGCDLLGDVVYGILGFGIAFAFLYSGLQEVGAGTTQVILACVPLLTIILAFAQRLEGLTARGIIGALLAAGGFIFVFRGQIEASVPLPSLLALLAGAGAMAETGVVVKWFPRTNPISKNAVGMAAGGFLLLVLSLVNGEDQIVPAHSATWTAIAYLVLIGSVVVFSLHLYVLNHWTASATSYQFVLIPFVTVALGAWLLSEKVTWAFATGAALVLAGVYIGAFWKGKKKPAEAHPQAVP